MHGSWGTGGVQCKIKPGQRGAGRQGEAFCYVQPDDSDEKWIVVRLYGTRSLEVRKASELLIKLPGCPWEEEKAD